MFDILPLPAFNDNYIWLIRDASAQKVAVVDPGDAGPVLAWLDKHPQWHVTDILITHHHHDHTGGIEALKARTQARVAAPADERVVAVDLPLHDGDHLQVLGVDVEVILVPGHTAGHIAYYLRGDTPLLFSGDTLFAAGCGRLLEGTPEQLHQSLQRLVELPDDTLVYCGHEYTLSNLRFARAADPDNQDVVRLLEDAQARRGRGEPTLPTRLAQEKAVNPFLRCHEAGVRRAVERERQLALDASDTACFATLRAWKDNF